MISLRGNSGFAALEIYDFAEPRGCSYAIRLRWTIPWDFFIEIHRHGVCKEGKPIGQLTYMCTFVTASMNLSLEDIIKVFCNPTTAIWETISRSPRTFSIYWYIHKFLFLIKLFLWSNSFHESKRDTSHLWRGLVTNKVGNRSWQGVTLWQDIKNKNTPCRPCAKQYTPSDNGSCGWYNP